MQAEKGIALGVRNCGYSRRSCALWVTQLQLSAYFPFPLSTDSSGNGLGTVSKG